jgi:hypothetical protein
MAFLLEWSRQDFGSFWIIVDMTQMTRNVRLEQSRNMRSTGYLADLWRHDSTEENMVLLEQCLRRFRAVFGTLMVLPIFVPTTCRP